jgi:hypothetical protein
MAPRLLISAVAALALPWAAPAAPQTDQAGDCVISLASLPKAVPRFEDFPAAGNFRGKPAAVDFTGNAAAREYRTAIRDGAAKGPNFARHYTIVGWGCGSACQGWALVNAAGGNVHLDKTMRAVDASSVGDNPAEPGVNADYDVLRFRRDSTLLIVLGAPGENRKRDGIAFYRWDGTALKPLAFFARDQVCAR